MSSLSSLRLLVRIINSQKHILFIHPSNHCLNMAIFPCTKKNEYKGHVRVVSTYDYFRSENQPRDWRERERESINWKFFTPESGKIWGILESKWKLLLNATEFPQKFCLLARFTIQIDLTTERLLYLYCCQITLTLTNGALCCTTTSLWSTLS